MKRCVECNSIFPDTERFCELDGTPLVSEPADVIRGSTAPATAKQSLLIIVAVVGVIIGVALFLAYFALTRERVTEDNSNRSTNTSNVAQQQLPNRPLEPLPVASPSPSVEPSPSPSVEPSPSTQPSPERIELSSNPISTAAGGKTGPVTIKLTNGVNIEAEEAWQTGEGIWYRRRGVVSLLDPKDVKTIEKPAASPQPTPSVQPKP